MPNDTNHLVLTYEEWEGGASRLSLYQMPEPKPTSFDWGKIAGGAALGALLKFALESVINLFHAH